MPIKLSPPPEQEFVLERTDKLFNNEGEPTKIKVRQATEGANLERMTLWKDFKRTLEVTDNKSVTSIEQSISPAEVKRKEVYLTLTYCNLQNENGEDWFVFPLNESRFNKQWALLPSAIATEIHEKVLQVNLDWSAEGESS